MTGFHSYPLTAVRMTKKSKINIGKDLDERTLLKIVNQKENVDASKNSMEVTQFVGDSSSIPTAAGSAWCCFFLHSLTLCVCPLSLQHSGKQLLSGLISPMGQRRDAFQHIQPFFSAEKKSILSRCVSLER